MGVESAHVGKDADVLLKCRCGLKFSDWVKFTGDVRFVVMIVLLFQGSSTFTVEAQERGHSRWPAWMKLSRVPHTHAAPVADSTIKKNTETPVHTPLKAVSPPQREAPFPAATSGSPLERPGQNLRDIELTAAQDAVEVSPETLSTSQAVSEGQTTVVVPVPPSPEAARESADLSGLTLEMLTALADTHHPRLTSAFQKLQAAQGEAIQAGLYPNPRLAVSSPQIDGKESQYNGFISQEFVTAKKLKLSTAALQREVTQAQFAWQQERFEILTDLRGQFYSTLTTQSRVAVLKSLVEIAHRSRDVSRKLLTAGEGTRSDTLLFDIEVDRAEVALDNSQVRFEVGRRQLALLVALPELGIEQLAGDLEATFQDYQIDELRYAVAAANPQSNIARLQIDRNAYRLQRAVVEPVPNIDIMGGYQRQVGIPAEDQGLFQVTMSVPLWNQNQGNIFAAQAQLAGARAELQRVELDLGNQAANALSALRTATQLVHRYEEQILPKARETLKISQQLYEQGQIDFLRLLQSQKTLLEAELTRLDAQEQRWLAASTIAGLLQQEHFP